MLSHLSRFATLRTLAGTAALAVVGTAGALFAGDLLPPASPAAMPPAKPVAISDVALARAVLAAIDADPVLKDVNLVVSVVDRGAVIGGPVATEEIKKRAEAVVRAVTGVESVKNVCFVQPDPDPLLRAVTERLKPDAKSTGVAALPGVALPPAAPEGFLPPVPPQPPSDLLAGAPKPVEALRPSLPSGPAVSVLGAPTAPGGSGAAVKMVPQPTTGPAPLPTAPGALTGSAVPAKPTDVPAAVAAIRKGDPRFARLTAESKPDGGLFVSGWSAKPADAWDFAAELRKLPGVVRVAVDPQLVK
ncbi:MAG: BON domain-containing protein [Planctomycetes bacterium]|nr:BON domain-containing protein [Planctomycetota bacterium]